MTGSADTVAHLPGFAALWRALRVPALALLAGIAVMGVAFAPEAAAAWRVWMESTAYSHCLFVLPIALYLAWERRGEILATPVVALPAAAVLMVPLGLVWLVAERLAIMEGRQLVALTMLEVLFLAVLGWRMARTMAAPLLYLYFLVPFGAFLTGPLQDFTAAFTVMGLEVLGIPHYADQYLIEIPEGRFYVAEACAGLRFLIASIAFGVLYGCVMYRSIPKRITFVAASIVVPIIANGFRALGIVVLGHVLGSAQAAATDHIVYGWLFFSVVTLILILAGLPFREDMPEAPPPVAAAPAGRMLPAAVVAAGLAAMGPAISAGLDRAGREELPMVEFAWTAPPGCSATRLPGEVAGSESVRFACLQGVLTATAQVFPERTNPMAITEARRRLTGEVEAEDVVSGNLEIPRLPLPVWRFTAASSPKGTVAVAQALMVDGAPAKGGLTGRIQLARNSVLGGSGRPVLLAVVHRSPKEQVGADEDRELRVLLGGFLEAQGGLEAALRRVGGD